jgi:hypothetical protein
VRKMEVSAVGSTATNAAPVSVRGSAATEVEGPVWATAAYRLVPSSWATELIVEKSAARMIARKP